MEIRNQIESNRSDRIFCFSTFLSLAFTKRVIDDHKLRAVRSFFLKY
jgi:hypothetical protein